MTKKISKFLAVAAIAIGIASPVLASGPGCVDTTGSLVLEKPRRGATGPQVFGCFERSFDTLSGATLSTSSAQEQYDAIALSTNAIFVELAQVGIDTEALNVQLLQVAVDTTAIQIIVDALDSDKVDRAGDTMTGALTLNQAGSADLVNIQRGGNDLIKFRTSSVSGIIELYDDTGVNLLFSVVDDGSGGALLNIEDNSSNIQVHLPATGDKFIQNGDLGIGINIPNGNMELRSNASASGFVLNVSSQSSSSMLVVNGLGHVGIGVTAPDGTLHLQSGFAGSVTADSSADDLVVENNSSVGISLLSTDSTMSRLVFGSVSDPFGAQIEWSHDANLMEIKTQNAGDELSLGTANGVEAIRIDSSQNVGMGIVSPDCNLHVQSGTAGTITPNMNADELCIEGSGNTGLSILSPDASDSALTFGSPSQPLGARHKWNHDDNIFRFTTHVGGAKMKFATGANIAAIDIDENQQVGIGNDTPGNDLEVSDSNAEATLEISTWDDGVSASVLDFQKSDSDTINTLLATGDGDTLGTIRFRGVDSSNISKFAVDITVVQDGAAGSRVAGELQFKTGTASVAPATRLTIKSDGNIGIGTDSPGATLDVAGDSHNSQFSNDSSGTTKRFKKSRNTTIGAHTIVDNGDLIGTLDWRGSNGTAYDQGAYIRGFIDAVPGASADMPMRISFGTSPDGSATPIDRMVIKANGQVGISQDLISAQLHIGGSAHLRFTNATGISADFFASQSNGTVSISADVGDAVAGTTIVLRVDNDTKMTIEEDGKVTISSDTLSIHGVAYNFPAAQGAVNQVLLNDGAGNLAWSSSGGGGGHTIATSSGTTAALTTFTAKTNLTFDSAFFTVENDDSKDSTFVSVSTGFTGQAYFLIETIEAIADSEVDITVEAGEEYQFDVELKTSASSTLDLRVNADSGSNYDYQSIGYRNGAIQENRGNPATFARLLTSANATSENNTIKTLINFGSEPGDDTRATWHGTITGHGSSEQVSGYYGGRYNGGSDVTSVRIFPTSGNITGTIRVFKLGTLSAGAGNVDLNGDNIMTGTNEFQGTVTISSDIAIVSGGHSVYGDRSDPNPLNIGQSVYWIKSADSVTSSSGCLVFAQFPDGGDSADQMVFTSTTTTTLNVAHGWPGVLLDDSCAPGDVCRVGMAGNYRVQYDTSGTLGTNEFIRFGSTKCRAGRGTAHDTSTMGTKLQEPSVSSNEFFWMRIR